MEQGSRNRVNPIVAVAVALVTVLALGTVYYFLCTRTSFGIPCLVYELTGIRCPGCGITRMFIALFHGNFREAFMYNQIMFFLWPFIVFEILYLIYMWADARKVSRINLILLYVVFGLLLVFSVVRNVLPI